MPKKLFLLLIIFNISFIASAKISEKTLRIGWYDQYPYTYSKKVLGVNTITGLDIELSRVILRKANYNFIFVKLPWEKQLEALRKGSLDLMLSGLVSEKRLKEYMLTVPIRKENTVIYTNINAKNKIHFKDVKNFLYWIKKNNFKIGITKGNIYTDKTLNSFLTKKINSKYLVPASCDYINLKNLKNGNIQASLVDETAGASIIGQNEWQQYFTYHYYPKFDSKDVCYMLSRKTLSKTDLENINKAIELTKEEGEFKEIQRTYFIPVLLNLTINSWWYFYIVLAGTIAYCLCALKIVIPTKQSLIGSLIFVSIYTIGGGGIRGIITGSYPLFFIHQPVYIYTIIIITLLVFMTSNTNNYLLVDTKRNKCTEILYLIFQYLNKIYIKYIYDIIDSIGLAAFIVFGVLAALEIKAKPLMLWGPILAMITTSGGGIICNMLSTKKFDRTMKNMYTEIAVIWGAVLSYLLYRTTEDSLMNQILFAVPFTVIGAFVTRWLVCIFKIKSISFIFVKPNKKKQKS